jgi:hypothetical protein
MDSEVSYEGKHHFISVVKPTVLILQVVGDNSNTLRLSVTENLPKCRVFILSLHSHSTHRMQPLGITYFNLLNTSMASVIALMLREKLGQRLSREYIASLVDMAFPRAAVGSRMVYCGV